MSKITVTTIAGATSGADANKVKIESGDTLEVVSNATVGGDLAVDTDTLKVDAANNRVGVGTASPSKTLHVSLPSGSGATPTSNSVAIIDGNDNTELSILGGSSSVLGINFGHSGDNNDGIINYNTTNGSEAMGFTVNATERMRINKDGYITTPNVPSFSVNATPSLSSNVFVNYGAIKFNNGNHYNNTNGKFTAPVAGKYFFTCSLWPTAGSIDNANSYLVFYKNNSEYFGGHVGEEYHNITISCVMNMAANDTVMVVRAGSWTIQASTPRNNFHGFLIG